MRNDSINDRRRLILPIHVLLELILSDDTMVSIDELCLKLSLKRDELSKILDVLYSRHLIIVNYDQGYVKLTGLALLYLQDLINLLKA